MLYRANLEEDLFKLIGNSSYEKISNWREITANDDAELRDRGMNRVTDVVIPEKVIKEVEKLLISVGKCRSCRRQKIPT